MASFSDKLFAKADKWLADYKKQSKKEAEKKVLAANAHGATLYSDGSFAFPADYSDSEAKDVKKILTQMYVDEAIKERKNPLRDVEDELYRIIPEFGGIRFGKDFDDNMWYEPIWKK